MRTGLLLLSLTSLWLAGCAFPGADTRPIKPMVMGADGRGHLAQSIEGKAVMYVGDAVTVYNADGAGPASLHIERSGASAAKDVEVPVAPDGYAVKIDAETIWKFEKLATEIALEFDFTPDGWGLLEE